MATITKRGPNTYRIRVYVGYDFEGKQIEKTMTWTAPPDSKMSEKAMYKAALAAAIKFEEKVRNETTCDGKIRFAAFADFWFANYADKNLRPRTVARYRELLRRINPYLGHMRLESIKPGHIIEFYRILENEGEAKTCTAKIDLKAFLKSRHLTKVAFSKQADVSLNTLSSVFAKKEISILCGEKIAQALDLPFDTLFRREESKKLSPTTIQHHHRLLHDILNSAVKWQYIESNPCSRVDPPKAKKPVISYLQEDQSKDFLAVLNEYAPSYYNRVVKFLLLTGVRRSEALGLEWTDVNWEEKYIRICRTSQYLPGQGLVTEDTKNRSSNRLVFVSDQVLDLLREQFIWRKLLEKKPECHSLKNHNRIFISPKGEPMHPDRLSQWFCRFVKRHNLPEGLHLHSLRHTYATLCLEKCQMPISSLSAQLGHSNSNTTLGIYTHSLKSSQLSAASQLGKMFNDVL